MPRMIFVNLPVTQLPRAVTFYEALVEAGAGAGGSADLNPPEDHGVMFQRTIADPDGHIWEPFWMDQAMAEGGSQSTVAQQA